MWPDAVHPQAAAPEQPIAFGPYQILARLAAGGMANVLLAREQRPAGARLVTIKTMLPELAERKDVVGMFLDEISLALQLAHPNCVQVYGSGQIRGTHFMSMEYVLGDTMAGLVSVVREAGALLPARVVAWIVACAAEALHYVHELKNAADEPLGLIHRDVSPQNVMVTYDGRVKLLDFGVAASKLKREATITGIIKGKVRYMSLEQLTGRKIDRRADVYSLGVVLFEALTTKRLIQAETQDAIVKTLTEQPLPSPQDFRPDLPDKLVWITSRAIALHPGDRYATTAEMAAELRDYIRTETDRPEAELTAYLHTLLGPRIAQRRGLCDRIIAGDIDLPVIRRTFDARRVLGVDIHADMPLQDNATIDDGSDPSLSAISLPSVQIPFESPIEWPANDLSMGSLEIAIDVAPEPPKGRLEAALPELGILKDRAAVDDLRLLELANLWLEPKGAADGVPALPPKIAAAQSSEDITQFAPIDHRPKRSSLLYVGLLMGAVIGGPLGGLITWLLTRN